MYPFIDCVFFIKVHAGQNVVQETVNPEQGSEPLIEPLVHLEDENWIENGGFDSGVDDFENYSVDEGGNQSGHT